MAFQFSLATVLRVRGIIEEREEGILQKILFDISKIFDDLERTDAQLAESNASRDADVFKPFIGLQVHASYGQVKAAEAAQERPRRANSKTRTGARCATHRLRGGSARSRNAHRHARKETQCV